MRAQSSLPAGFEDSVIFSGLDMPTGVRFSPDGRVFVAEKSGLVKVFESLSDTQASVFADLRTQVHNFWDRGLLGFALDPNFPAEPYVYVLYTRDATIGGTAPRWGQPNATSDPCPTPPGATDDGCVASGRLSRLRAAGNVMTGAEQVLVDGWFQQFPSHSMGSIAFGPDGALYASGGESSNWQYTDYGQAGDPPNPAGDPPVPVGGTQQPPTAEGGALRAQDLRTSGDPVGLSGSVIRVNRATGAPLPDNPLISHSDINARRIVAYGLRNPFRIATRPGSQELWIGDVGWRLFDEINRIVDPRVAVRNFGWPCYEGNAREPNWDPVNVNICENLYAEAGAVTAPYFQYRQGSAVASGDTCSVTDAALSGLAFYGGGSYPAEYDGALFFGDYARKCIWVMRPGSSGVPSTTQVSTFIRNAEFPVDLQIGPNGDLVYVDFVGGTVRRITYGAGNQAPNAVATATPDSGQPPLSVTFDGSGSADPENGPLTYSWDLDGNGTFGDSTAVRPTRTYTANGTYIVRLRVTDAAGLTDTTSVTVVVANTRPTAFIDTPDAGLQWRVGQSVSFSGHATDPEDGSLGASAFHWSLIMHHCSTPASCHQHPIQEYADVTGGSFTAPDHEYPSYLELRLTVTDAGGLTGERSLRLDPRTVKLTLQSVPSGLRIEHGGGAVTTPATITALVGSKVSLSAPSPQTLSGASYAFSSWSDGGAQAHTITTGETPQTLTATYTQTVSTGQTEIVLHAKRATIKAGTWRLVADSTAAGAQRLEQPNAGALKISPALASPAHYVEVTFNAEAKRGYRLWLRGRAEDNYWGNDSVHVQFDRSVNSAGSPVFRIGTTDASSVTIENCTGCGLSGWGWQDNAIGNGVFGPLIYFAATGPQTLRIQAREDGISIDQIVLSSFSYVDVAPGATKNDTTILPETGDGPPPPPPPAGAGEIVMYASEAPVIRGAWRAISDATAAGNLRLEHPDAGATKLTAALASPTNYFEMTFQAEAGRPYRLWLRGRAANDAWANDSVFVQFDGSLDQNGNVVYRIGTTNSATVTLEDCLNCGVKGWGWQDNGYGAGVMGPVIYFERSGPQAIRIQTREDGFSIDQVVLSSETYLTASPGALKNDVTILPRTP